MNEKLKQDRIFLDFLMQSLPDRIYFKDTESRFLRANKALAKLFHLENPDDLIGKSDFDLFPDKDAQRMFDDEQGILRTGEPILDKVESKTLPDGSLDWTHTTKLPLHDAEGRVIGTAGISKDITNLRNMAEALENERNRLRAVNAELKEAQAQLVEAEKTESIARLAFGVAHEVKNPLAVLGMGLEYLSSEAKVAGDDPVLQEMRAALHRADSIITELLTLSTSSEARLSPAPLQAILDQALESLQSEADKAKVRIIREYCENLRPVSVESDKIECAFFSLMQNAVQAMDPGGVLTVRTYAKTLGEEDVTFDPGFRSANRFHAGETIAVVEIDDTGKGIPNEDLRKVFEPFFTTKPTGEGTGLGLTVCRKLFESHHAILQIENRPEGGVRATVIFKQK